MISIWAREWSTCWNSTHVFYCLGFESGQHSEILWRLSIILDSSVVNLLRLLNYVFLDVGVESGPHVDIQPMYSIALVLRVAIMLRFYEYVLLSWTWEWSASWDSTNMFFYLELESCQHVEILPMFSFALDSRLVDMLRFYDYSILFWIREWPTWWDSPIMLF